MKWFRFYDEVLDDPKCQRLTPMMFRHWVNILCIANRSNQRGTLPAVEHIAFSLRLTEAKTMAVINDLVTAGLLDRNGNETFSPHGWSTRQRVSDDVAQRVSKHRERNESEPLPKQKSNVTDTLPHARATEAETETEPPIPPTGDERGDNVVDVLAPLRDPIADRWSRFIAAYPKRKGTGAAERAFRKIAPSEGLLAQMIAAIEIEKTTHDWTKENGQFIPFPATWINQKRWNDDPGGGVAPPGPANVDLLPGESAEDTGDGTWTLHGTDGKKRYVHPKWHGVVFDQRKHLNDGRQAFDAAVEAAKAGDRDNERHAA